MHNKQASIYKEMGWDQHQFTNLARLQTIIDLPSVHTAHDIACGTGDFTDTLSKQGISATGSDLSPSMISRARSLYPGHNFSIADMRTISLPSPVDLITINYFSLNMVPMASDIKKTLANIASNLNSGGYLAFDFSTPGFVLSADIHDMREENGIIIKEDITSSNGICTFDLSWLTTNDGIHYLREFEKYTEVTLSIDDLKQTLITNGLTILSMTPISSDELTISDYDKLTEGLYIVAQKSP